MKTFKFVLILAVSLILCATNVYANSFDDQFGSKITIPDNRNDSSNPSTSGNWYSNREDNEVEPDMVRDQRWDLEGFLLKNNTLSIVAGFDLKDGYNYGGYPYNSGDIFIDVISQTSGFKVNNTNNTYSYEYVLDMDYSTGKYSVFALTNASVMDNGKLTSNGNDPLSAPYRYPPVGTAVTYWQNISFSYYDFDTSLMTDELTRYSGYSPNGQYYGHNALSVNLGFLPGGTEFISHFTIECGNDNLMGQGRTTAVPEPATLLLLGMGLVGLGLSSRKFKK